MQYDLHSNIMIMKKILFSAYLLLTLGAGGFTQPTTITTCKGGAVSANIQSAGTSAQKATWRQQFLNWGASNGLGASDILAEASSAYNCHAYAWHLREGNTNQVWVNNAIPANPPACLPQTHNIDRYWTDGCFIKVCNVTDADKIHYYCGDHSAVNSTVVAGKFESKWGSWPVIRHNPTTVPYLQPNSVNYYASTKINGSTANLCSGTRTFTVKSISGAVYSWANSSGLVAVGANNQASYSVQWNGSASGAQWVDATITIPCSGASVTNRVNFSVGGTISPLTGTYSTSSSTKVLNTVNFVPAGNIFVQFQWPGATNIVATLAPGSPSGTGFFATSTNCSFNIAVNQNVSVNFTATGTCGDQIFATRTFVYSSSPFRLVASPNPAKDDINLAVSTLTNGASITNPEEAENLNSNTKGMTKMYLYDVYTNQPVRQWTYRETKASNYRLNITGVRTGVYLLKMERDNKTASTKVIVE